MALRGAGSLDRDQGPGGPRFRPRGPADSRACGQARGGRAEQVDTVDRVLGKPVSRPARASRGVSGTASRTSQSSRVFAWQSLPRRPCRIDAGKSRAECDRPRQGRTARWLLPALEMPSSRHRPGSRAGSGKARDASLRWHDVGARRLGHWGDGLRPKSDLHSLPFRGEIRRLVPKGLAGVERGFGLVTRACPSPNPLP